MAHIAPVVRLIVCFEHNYMGILRIDETTTIMIEEAKAHINRGTSIRSSFCRI